MRTMRTYDHFSVYFPDRVTIAKLRTAAKREGLSVAAYIRRCVEDALAATESAARRRRKAA